MGAPSGSRHDRSNSGRCARAAARRQVPALDASRQLGAALGGKVDGAALADVVEVLLEEALYGNVSARAQLLEEVEVGIHLRARGQAVEHAVERDAVHVD